MKKLFISLVFVLPFASLAAVGIKTDLQKENLKGPVQTLRIETAQFASQSGRWREGPRELSATITYDAIGNRSVAIGNISTGKIFYTYNTQGLLAETRPYNFDDSLSGRTVYIHDAKGNLIKEVSDGADDSSHWMTLYTYNAKEQLAERISCDAVGCFDKATYTYDPQGNLIEESFYYPDNSSIKLRLAHTYNEQRRRTQTESYDSHDTGLGIEKTAQTYDAKGNILEVTTYYTEKVGDEDGKPIPPPSKFVYTYEFDLYGNWVKQTQTLCTAETGKPVCEPSLVTYRTISYYSDSRMPSIAIEGGLYTALT